MGSEYYSDLSFQEPSPIPFTSCKYQLSPSELVCYQTNYPDLAGKNNTELQNHWNTTGCNQQRYNQCPSYTANSGLYNYKGCFNNNSCSGGTGIKPIPNNRGIVNNIKDCATLASNYKETLFAVQSNNNNEIECLTGTNVQDATKYGENYSRNDCSLNGTKCSQQLYISTTLFSPPVQSASKLTDANFADQIESFKNKNNSRFILLFIIFIIIFLFFYYKFY